MEINDRSTLEEARTASGRKRLEVFQLHDAGSQAKPPLSLSVHWDASLTLVSVVSCFLIGLTLEGLSKIFQPLLEQFSHCHIFILDAQCRQEAATSAE